MRYYLSALLLLVLACEPQTAKEPATSKVVRDDKGRIIEGPLKVFYPSGKLKGEVNYKNGKLHGRAVKYYEDGTTIKSELHYEQGKLHGLQKRYYKTGALYKTENFNMGVRDGEVKKYRRNGRLMTETLYRNGYPGIYLKEYLTNGKLKKKYPSIKVKTLDRLAENGTYTLRFYLSDNSKKVTFYQGKLHDGYLHKGLQELPAVNGVLDYEIKLEPGQAARGELYLVAKVVTRLNNVYITTAHHKLAVERPW